MALEARFVHASILLATQLHRIGEILGALSAQVDVTASRMRAFPGTNLIGYTLWHLARTVDWSVNTMVRGTAEVAFDFKFEGAADPRVSQIGFGVQLHEADAIAESTTPAEVARYFDLVLANVTEWLRRDPDLSLIPNISAHQPDFPGYRTDFYLEEARSYKEAGWTTMQILAGPATAHVRGHFGEIDVLRQILACER
jgi:hypothetical protein